MSGGITYDGHISKPGITVLKVGSSGIHGCANCQSLLCLKSAFGIQAVYNELLHCVWATGLVVQLDNQAGSDIFT